MNFHNAFIKFFNKAFVIKLFQVLSPILTSISRENIIEIPLTLKKHCQAKFCLVDAWNYGCLNVAKLFEK